MKVGDVWLMMIGMAAGMAVLVVWFEPPHPGHRPCTVSTINHACQ